MSLQTAQPESAQDTDVAIIGQAGRFPGANDLAEFWQNLKHGIEAIRFYSEDEILESGVFPEMAHDPDFVPAAGGIDHEYDFDADFFGYSPREAEITDPQQRVALECAWEAIEAAGYNPDDYGGRIGVFAGASINTYLLFNLAPNRHLLNSIGHFQVMTANDKDFLATRISYKLNLRGPAMSVQTACSTSLVAVNLGCQSLLNYQSDIVLAGGTSITPKGRLYKEGFIFSKDGRCRAFDKDAQGTVGGNGVGFVVLKRLQDALSDGDHIHAVIKGSAVNNDGSLKVGYTAPSVSGQVDVIVEAQAVAGVDPETITYVEAHGTGTLLGDPIEIAALTQAFRAATDRKEYCAVGSVKTNIGHLDTAAGISGLIKAVLSVEHGQIPPSLHFNSANPQLNLEGSPFYVNTVLRDWKANGVPRRAAVSSFGFGGTNAHTILEQAPVAPSSTPKRETQLLLVSGRNQAALKGNLERLGRFLSEHPQVELADVAYTLQVGRKAFGVRACLTANDVSEATAKLAGHDTKHIRYGTPREAEPSVVFAFSGQGSQYVGMARDLYQGEPAFRGAFDDVAEIMCATCDLDIVPVIYPPLASPEAEALLNQTQYTQPALFAVEYALARLWQSWGIEPSAMIGHSIGEYVAATLAGVFHLSDAARLVCLRGRLIQAQPRGSMLSVPLPAKELEPFLNERLSVAAVNAPGLSVLAGDSEAIEVLERLLAGKSIHSKRLAVSHTFHSHMLEPAARDFEKICATVIMNEPKIPYVSNVAGDWATSEQATSPRYWAAHMRNTVRFSDGLTTILKGKPSVLLEVGPGQALTTLARQHRDQVKTASLVSSTRHPSVSGSDVQHALRALGELWVAGVSPDWQKFHHHGQRQRVPLPTYAFQRQRYWLPPLDVMATSGPASLRESTPERRPQTVQAGDAPDKQLPRDEAEQTVAGIWERMLGFTNIGANEDFFKLGGHSLLATQLVAEVRRVTETDVSVKMLFKDPTIAGLAEEVRRLRADDPDFRIGTVPTISRNQKLPLTFHQEAVWDFERSCPGTARFNGCIGLRLTGELDMDALHFAVDEIFRRHEVLRTNFRYENGTSEAIIRPARHMDVQYRDLSATPAERRERRLIQVANELARRPFDLSKDVYIRTTLVKTAPTEHVLVVASHYVAVDGWTIGVVIQEFAAHYSAFKDPSAPRLPELPFQIVDYAAWERQKVNDDAIEAHVPYWREQFVALTPQRPVVLDRPRSVQPSIRGASYHFSLDHELTEAVKAFSHQQGYTVFMTFVAALDVLFYSQSGIEDVVIGTMLGDRESGTEAMVGALVNMVALRTKLTGESAFLGVLESVRKTATDAYTHQVPFSALMSRLNRDPHSEPLFRTVFILRSVPQAKVHAEKLDVELAPLPLDRGVSDVDLTLYLQEKHGVFSGYFEYSVDLFKRSTIEVVASRLVALVREVLANPDVPLAKLPFSTQKRPALIGATEPD